MPKVTWLRSGRVRDGAHITSPSAQYSFWFVIPASLNPNLCCYWILKLFFIWHECVCGATSNTQQEYLLGWSNCCNKQPPRSQQLAARVVGRVKTASCSHWGIQAPPIFFYCYPWYMASKVTARENGDPYEGDLYWPCLEGELTPSTHSFSYMNTTVGI